MNAVVHTPAPALLGLIHVDHHAGILLEVTIVRVEMVLDCRVAQCAQV